jgi:small subunit ribosomal protein S3
MIERQIVDASVKELKVQEYVTKALKNLGQSHIKLQKTPLGEKIIVHASRPGLIVGRKGQNIKKLTEELKEKFNLENPQLEINEVTAPDLDAQIVAERIAGSLEKFGTQRFKGIGHKIMSDVMNAGALGIEILISGKIPSARAKRWRFYSGYLKKCGDVAITGVRKAYAVAQLKTGSVGIQVRIMSSDIKLPDKVLLKEEMSKVSEQMRTELSKDNPNEKTKETKENKEQAQNKEQTKPKKGAAKKAKSQTDKEKKTKKDNPENKSVE